MKYNNQELYINDLIDICNDRVTCCEIIDTGNIWTSFQRKLKKEIQEIGINNVLQCKTIKNTMFYIPSKKELDFLYHHNEWVLYERAIIEETIGNPCLLINHPLYSGNLIHHCYSWASYLDFVQKKDFLRGITTIYEFGGGYGSFCRLLCNLNFAGKYVIHDIPLFLVIQYFYLSCYSAIRFNILDNLNNANIIQVNASTSLHLQNQSSGNEEFDLFVGLWSLSEIPISSRHDIIKKVQSSKYVMIGLQEFFNNERNVDYFSSLIEQDKEKIYVMRSIPHIPHNFYLFGKPR